MSVTTEIISNDGEREWSDYVAAHPRSTIYHTWPWKQIFEESFGYRSRYVVARRSGGEIIGCVPLFLVASPVGRRLVAVPFRDRGGVLWSADEAFSALVEAAKSVAATLRASVLELKSVDSYPADLCAKAALDLHHSWVRSFVPLNGLTRETLWQKLGSKTRNMIRQSEEAGLTCVDETGSASVMSDWYALFLDTQKRQGLPPFPRAFFESLQRRLGDAAMKIFVVRRAGVPLAATIILLHKNRAIYGYSASTRDGQSLRANDLMLFTVMTYLIANGYEEFDLGSDSPKQESLLFFKRKWLATQEPVPSYTFGASAASHPDSSDAKYDRARAVFRRLPKPVLRAIGAATAKYFG